MSSTTPVSPSKVTRSPIRIGCEIASRIPAIPLASVWRAAKPTTMPSTADEARTPVAVRLTASNWLSASITPISTIDTVIRRRTSRSRVVATGDSGPTAAVAAFVARLTR